MDPYLKSLMNPFIYKGSPIPDGNNHDFICNDMVAYSDVSYGDTVTAGGKFNFTMQTFPFLPYLAGIQSLSKLEIDSKKFTEQQAAITSSNLVSGFAPICFPEVFLSSNNVYTQLGVFKDDPWGAAKARMGSIGYKILYTGPINTCSGSITVTPSNIVVTPFKSAVPNLNVTSTGTVSSVNPNNTVSSAAKSFANTLAVEINRNNGASYKTSRTFRPEETIYVLPKRANTINQLSPILPAATAVLANISSSEASDNLYNFVKRDAPDTVTSHCGGIVWYDDNWESFVIQFRNINQDASFRIEAIACFELTLKTGSPFIDLSMASSPNKPNVMDKSHTISDNILNESEMARNGASMSSPGSNL